MKLRRAVLGATLVFGCGTPDAIEYGDPAGSGGSESGGEEGGFCGDGIVQSGESCDDGNADDLDACHDDCTVPGSTLWVALMEDSWAVDVAVATDAVYVKGSQPQSPFADWIAAFDRDGIELDTRWYADIGIMGIAVSEDDRLVFARTVDDLGENQVCARNGPSDQDQCLLAEWEGDEVWVGPVDAGFGRVASVVFLGAYYIRELDADVGISGQIEFMPPYYNDHLVHGFTPTGHVVAQKWEESVDIYWLDNDGLPGQQSQIAVPLQSTVYGVVADADGRLALNIAAPTVADTRVASIESDGQAGPTIPAAGSIRGIAFAANGDLFTVEVTGEEEIQSGQDVEVKVELARWTPEGTERWRRAWAEPGEQAYALRIGHDGTLYIAGRRSPVDGNDASVSFLRAVRP